jgi:nitroreductase
VATASPDDLDRFDALHRQRALRYCQPDPVPNDLIQKILEAAIRAPSGGN